MDIIIAIVPINNAVYRHSKVSNPHSSLKNVPSFNVGYVDSIVTH